MNCEDAIKKVDRFVRQELSTKELKEFLDHVDNCPSCYEELETYYMVEIALDLLDQNREEEYNISSVMKESIARARIRAHREMMMYSAFRIILILVLFLVVLLLILGNIPEAAEAVGNIFNMNF